MSTSKKETIICKGFTGGGLSREGGEVKPCTHKSIIQSGRGPFRCSRHQGQQTYSSFMWSVQREINKGWD